MAMFARTREVRRRDHPRARVTFLRGTLVVIAFLAIGFQLLRLYNGVPTADYKTVYVSTPIVGNLLSHDAVRVAGKRIGQVLDIDVGSDGRPRVELQLNPGEKLPADTQVRVRANGLLGARYVELVPGKSRELLADDATIRGSDSSYTYGLPEAIDVFDSKTRDGLAQTLRGLGAGALSNGKGLNTTIKQARTYTPQFESIMRSILRREGAAERLLPSTSAAFVNLGRNTQYVEPWLDAVGDALVPFIGERAAVRDTLSEAPGTLAAAESGLGRGVKLLAAARRLSGAAARTLPPMPEGTRALSKLLDEGRGPVKRLWPKFVRQAHAGVNAPWDGGPALERLRPRINELLENVRPIMQEIADHQCDIRNGAATLRSMTGFEQTTQSGELGQAMAFRLQAVAPSPSDLLGTSSTGGAGTLVKRAGYPADCVYDSKPYPQFPSLAAKAGGR